MDEGEYDARKPFTNTFAYRHERAVRKIKIPSSRINTAIEGARIAPRRSAGPVSLARVRCSHGHLAVPLLACPAPSRLNTRSKFMRVVL